MNQSENPYQSPCEASTVPASPIHSDSRPVSPMLFGILSLAFGGLGLLFAFNSLLAIFAFVRDQGLEATSSAIPVLAFIAIGFRFLLKILLLVSGVGLIKYMKKGRTLFNLYAILAISLGMFDAIYGIITLRKSGFASPLHMNQIIVEILILIFPLLGLIILNNARVNDSLT